MSLLALTVCLLLWISSVHCFVPCSNASSVGYCLEGWHCCDNGWCCSDDFVCGDNRCIYLKGLYVPVGIIIVALCGGLFFCIHSIRKQNRYPLSARVQNELTQKLHEPEDFTIEHV